MPSLIEPLAFLAPSGLSATVSGKALTHVHRFRQTTCWKREAGGQLFAKVLDAGWLVEEATGPRINDIRSRFGFEPDRPAERREIQKLFATGLHYVGDWHTHPEPTPTPSQIDLNSIRDMVQASKHELPGFLMLIVGTNLDTTGYSLTLHRVDGSWEKFLPLALDGTKK